MRISTVFLAGGIAGLAIAAPVRAAGLEDLAKVVLGGGSILKKGQEKCGSALRLTQNDSLAITFARAAAERALPISQFTLLDQTAEADAVKQAETPTFCPETKQKKSGLMKAIKKAGKSILMTRVLGG
jgi:antitoxin component of RelBE/YafQ-DinJ toxin-antitoxin module